MGTIVVIVDLETTGLDSTEDEIMLGLYTVAMSA